ncbi:unnamed protein product [Symbiodinium sp. CCMP2592]|nr:unnamed protein product [Symbiodinium sp. CCMP2592]
MTSAPTWAKRTGGTSSRADHRRSLDVQQRFACSLSFQASVEPTRSWSSPGKASSLGQFVITEVPLRLRIRKEQSREFSLRLAVRALDVTKKPNQVDPGAQGAADALLDEETARNFRAHLVAKTGAPGHFELWPETSQHDVGWLVQDNTGGRPFEDRQTLVAAKPGLGFGWRHASVLTPPGSAGGGKVPAAARQRTPSAGTPAPSLSGKSSVLPPKEIPAELLPTPAERALPWFPGVGRLRRRRRLLRRQLAEEATAAAMEPKAVLPTSPAPSTASSARPGPTDGFRNFRRKSIPDAWLGPSCEPPKPTADAHETIEGQSQRAREFLRYGKQSRWERTKEVSNMSKFAKGYKMLWGVNFFAKRGSKRSMEVVA